ncbi:MAG: hypothetical protein IJT94_10000 [Oscillibacter sp.]|nr:hypothetical protein [Oscillibacter sp.]
MSEGLDRVGREILLSARDELYLHFHYLDAALCALDFVPGNTPSLATDGETLFYDGAYLSDRFLRSPVLVSRAYLHTVFHCMLRHLSKKRGKVPELWDLACDAAVESILDNLDERCVQSPAVPARLKFYGECLAEMKVLTAEGIYRHLLRRNLAEYELAPLQRLFFADDHSLWDPERNPEQSDRQDQKWRDTADRSRTALETVTAGRAEGGETVLEQVRASLREDVDYRAFLRRFAAPREVVGVDGDSFDYGYYSYGLRLYGNLPLLEPPETREEKRIENFVIAIDTSMSTSGDLVRQFLGCTWGILRSTGTFTRAVNIRLIQCDDQVRADTPIHSLDDLKALADTFGAFQLAGGSATDFRPVFAYVEQLRKAGELPGLRGLVYFTDGMGIYPKKRPPYDTAFVLMEEPPLSVEFPPWAIRLVLSPADLERAAQAEAGRDREWDTFFVLDELPEL